MRAVQKDAEDKGDEASDGVAPPGGLLTAAPGMPALTGDTADRGAHGDLLLSSFFPLLPAEAA